MPEIENKRLNFPVTRTPLTDVDATDIAAVRTWLLDFTEHRVRNEGRLTPKFRYLHAKQQEVFEVGEPELGEERHHAIFLRHLGQRPGVVRRFREGELLVEVDGAHRRAVVLMELDPNGLTDAWWVAWRLMGEREGRVGVFHGDWVTVEGLGALMFPEACADWFPRGEVVTSEMSETPTELPMPEILMAVAGMLKPIAQDPLVALEVIGHLTDADIVKNGLNGIQVIAFRGLSVEQFLIRGRSLLDVDDLIRAIAQQGDTDAIAVIVPGIMNLDGLDTRAIIELAEVRDGRRAQRAMPVKLKPDGTLDNPRFWTVMVPAAELGEGWIGVPPTQEISLFPMPAKGQEMAEG